MSLHRREFLSGAKALSVEGYAREGRRGELKDSVRETVEAAPLVSSGRTGRHGVGLSDGAAQ